jgi:hypothetical protein
MVLAMVSHSMPLLRRTRPLFRWSATHAILSKQGSAAVLCSLVAAGSGVVELILALFGHQLLGQTDLLEYLNLTMGVVADPVEVVYKDDVRDGRTTTNLLVTAMPVSTFAQTGIFWKRSISIVCRN